VLVLGGALGAGGVAAWRWLGRLTDAYCTMLREDADADGVGDGPASEPGALQPAAELASASHRAGSAPGSA